MTTDNETFVVEEVTPYRMELVDQLKLEDLERGVIPDNRYKLRHFRCVLCGKYAAAIDLHLGETQAILGCPFCAEAPSAETPHKPLAVVPTTPREIEFYRPLTEEEIAQWRDATTQGAWAVVDAMGVYLSDAGGDATAATIIDAAATRLINGALLARLSEQSAPR